MNVHVYTCIHMYKRSVMGTCMCLLHMYMMQAKEKGRERERGQEET